MCYPKPGPRCSNHARKRLVQASARSQRERTIENSEAVKEAEHEFFQTPAGFRELEHLIRKGDDVEYDTYRLSYYKEVRAQALAAIKAEDAGDTEHKLDYNDGFNRTRKLLPFDTSSVRHTWNSLPAEEYAKLEEQYIEASARWVDKLTDKEILAVKWFTSNGFHEMGEMDRGAPFQKYSGQNETDEQKAKRITRDRKVLDRALRKVDGQPRIVYRGLSEYMIPDSLKPNLPKAHERDYSPRKKRYASEEEYEQAKSTYFDGLVGTTVNFDRPVSAAADISSAASFAGRSDSGASGLPQIVYEISTRKGAPAGAASTWGTIEAEVIVQGNQKYEIVGVKRNAEIKSASYRDGEAYTRTVDIIQLKEIQQPAK